MRKMHLILILNTSVWGPGVYLEITLFTYLRILNVCVPIAFNFP